MNLDEINAIRKRDQEFTEWRKQEIAKLPEIAQRVFALRKAFYMGCGFHWSLEKKLGAVIRYLNDYDDHTMYNTPDAIATQITIQVIVEGLYEDVAKAEQSTQLNSPQAFATRYATNLTKQDQIELGKQFYNALATQTGQQLGNIYHDHGMSICCYGPKAEGQHAIPVTILWEEGMISINSIRYPITDKNTYSVLHTLLS